MLYHRYLEEGKGSILFVLSRTAPWTLIATLATLSIFSGFMFTNHPGLSGLGLVGISGLLITLSTVFLWFPLIIGYFESTRKQNS